MSMWQVTLPSGFDLLIQARDAAGAIRNAAEVGFPGAHSPQPADYEPVYD